MMTVDRRGVTFTAGWESFVPWVYDDKARAVVTAWQGLRIKAPPRWQPGTPVKGTLTAGFGHTDGGRHPLKMHELAARGTDLTKEEAYEILDADMDDVERAVNRLVTVPLSQGQFDALCDLAFNIGAGNFRKSTVLARLNAGNYAGARATFDLYVNSKGERLAGLVRRRDAEQALFDERRAEAAVPHEDEAFEETPKDVEAAAGVKPLAQSNTLKGVVTGATSIGVPTAGAIVKAASESGADMAAPTVTERVTQVVDRAGNVIDTVKTVHEALPVPEGFWLKAAHLALDPVVLAIFGTLAVASFAFIAYERWRKHHYEGV